VAFRGLLAMLPGLLACNSGTETPDVVLEMQKAPVADGDQQSWSTGHNIPNPLRVLITSRGVPMEGVDVAWQADAGEGTLTPLIAVTGADGISTARWTLSVNAGTHHGQATVEGATGSPVRFTATAYPNFPHQLHIASGDGQSQPVGTTLSEPLMVRVGDQFDNPFPGASVEWIVTSGSGRLATSLSMSDVDGLARNSLTLGPTPGPVSVLARFPGGETGPDVTFQSTATPAP
jgi:hypothetical protein